MQSEERIQEIKNEIDRIESSLRVLRIELKDTERDQMKYKQKSITLKSMKTTMKNSIVKC